MTPTSSFVSYIKKDVPHLFYLVCMLISTSVYGQQSFGIYGISLTDGWKLNNAKSEASEYYYFEKDGNAVAILKEPKEATGGMNKVILDYTNQLKGTDEFIEQQKQSVPVYLYGKSQSTRLTIKSKSTGTRRFVYLTQVDNKVYETRVSGSASSMDPAPEAIQFLSKVSVDKNAANEVYAEDSYRKASGARPAQIPHKPADVKAEGTIGLPLPGHEMEDPIFQNQKETAKKQKEIKAAIIYEITEHINRYQNSCFEKKINLGNPIKFKEAIEKQINFIYTGQEGAKRIKETGPDAIARHHVWLDVTGYKADLMFTFDPRNIPEEDRYENRKTLMHEMTHHIEFIKGVKESSTTYIFWDNPKSERNTHYQEGVFFQMFQLKEIEERLANGKSNIADELFKYGSVEMNLHRLEKGGSAGDNPPDISLEMMTGFNARYDLIENFYLSGACGSQLRKLVMLYKLLWRIDQKLDFDHLTINQGQEIVAYAELKYRTDIDVGRAPMNAPSELMPVYTWNLPDGRKITGNPLKFTPEAEGDFNIEVELNVTFEKETLTIARGTLVVSVLPNKKETKVVSSEIQIADKVLATDLIDAGVILPKEAPPKIVIYEWSPCASGPDKNKEKIKIQFSNKTEKPMEQIVTVSGKDAAGNTIMSTSKKVTVIPVTFPAPALIPAGQESSHGPWGVHVNGQYKERKRDGHVRSVVYLGLDISWIQGDASSEYNNWDQEMKKKTDRKSKMIAIDGFQGFVYETEYKKDCRGSGFVDLGYIEGSISGEGIVIKGCAGIKFSYTIYGTGVIEGEGSGFCKFEQLSHDDSEFIKSNITEAHAKVKSFIEGIKLVPK